MKKLKNYTIQQYLDALSKKIPAPGGGSAAALTAALGAGLLSMVANYSLGKSDSKSTENQIKKNLEKTENIRKRLTELIDLDAEAYMEVVKARKGSDQERKAALKKAVAVPLEVGKLCYKAVELAPILIEKGNKYLLSDVEAGCEMLLAGFNSAMANVEANS